MPPIAARKRAAAIARRKPKTSNVTFRLTPDQKTLLEEGTALSGAPDMTFFVLAPALDRARELAERESVTILTAESRKVFYELMETPPAPSERLLRKLRDTRIRIVD